MVYKLHYFWNALFIIHEIVCLMQPSSGSTCQTNSAFYQARTHSLLVSIVVVFALSWFPLNVLNIILDVKNIFQESKKKIGSNLLTFIFSVPKTNICSKSQDYSGPEDGLCSFKDEQDI
jgi:hypothetical protein